VTDAPDPLGKRALFWAPAARVEEDPLGSAQAAVPGKHALFSDEARAAPVLSGPGRRITARAANDRTRRAASADRLPERLAARAVGPAGRLLPSVAVACSECGASSNVDLVEFFVLHLPVWFWKPGRGYSRFMTCPVCRRRTWVSTSWARRPGQPTAQDAG
jgi:hypothetical protein